MGHNNQIAYRIERFYLLKIKIHARNQEEYKQKYYLEKAKDEVLKFIERQSKSQ